MIRISLYHSRVGECFNQREQHSKHQCWNTGTKLDDDDDGENSDDVESVKLPQTPIVEFMTETTRVIVKKSAISPSKKENESENLTHLTLMSKNQQRRHWETKQGRASFVRKMSQRKMSPTKSNRFENLSVVTSPDSKQIENFDLTAPMASTFHHAIQSSRSIAADALMKMTTTGFAKEDVMFRTSSPERKKRRRVSKGRRRAIRWFRSPTRGGGNTAKKSMKTFPTETSILNKIGRQLFGDSSSSRGEDVSNVSVHHETPVHLLPEEQLFADPSTQWVVEEYVVFERGVRAWCSSVVFERGVRA